MKLKSILLFITLFISFKSFSQKAFQLASPNGHILMNVAIGDTVSYSISVHKIPLLSPSPIALLTENHKSLGIKSTFTTQQSRAVSETIINAEKKARDYSMGYQLVDPTTTLRIHLTPSGGYVAKLIKL